MHEKLTFQTYGQTLIIDNEKSHILMFSRAMYIYEYNKNELMEAKWILCMIVKPSPQQQICYYLKPKETLKMYFTFEIRVDIMWHQWKGVEVCWISCVCCGVHECGKGWSEGHIWWLHEGCSYKMANQVWGLCRFYVGAEFGPRH